jgi:hypothetical protein
LENPGVQAWRLASAPLTAWSSAFVTLRSL